MAQESLPALRFLASKRPKFMAKKLRQTKAEKLRTPQAAPAVW